MMPLVSRRRVVASLLAALAAPVVLGCGGDASSISQLPDQGKPVAPRKPGEVKREKGMDRDGS